MFRRVKVRKGECIRPCAQCEQPVKFIKGAWAVHGGRRKGWHWVNDDGSHHRCRDFIEAVENQSKQTGDTYFTGLLNSGAKLVMLRNNRRENDNEPHWNLYLTERENGSRQPRRTEPTKPKKPRRRKTKPPSLGSDPDDDISDLWPI